MTQQTSVVADGKQQKRPTAERGKAGVLVAVAIATFLLMLDLTVVNVALPDIQQSLDASFSQLQWVLDAYAVGLAVFVLASGTLGDRYGRKRLFLIGLVVFTVASLLCGVAPDTGFLIAARALQGVAGAVLFSISPAILNETFVGKQRGLAFGVFGGVAGIAIAFGPLIGGALTDGASWHWIFLMNVPLGIVALVLASWMIRETKSDRRARLDIGGFVTFTIAVTALTIGLVRAQETGWGSTEVVTLFIVAGVFLIGFVLLQWRRGENAMVDLTLFRTPTVVAFSLVTFISSAAVMASLFLLIAYVQNAWGFSAWETGVRFLPLTLTLTLAAAIAGSLTSRIAPNLILGLSSTFIASGLFLTLLTSANADQWTSMIPAMICLGIGMGLFNPTRASLSVAVAEPEKAGMASGVSETFQQVGVALGIAALGSIFASRVKDAFLDSKAADLLGDHAPKIADGISTGGLTGTNGTALPAELQQQIMHDALQASTDGLHFAMIVAAWASVAAAVLAFTLIRKRDLRQQIV